MLYKGKQRKDKKMIEKKGNVIKSPDLTKMQAVVINPRTTIFITTDADPEEARTKYLERRNEGKKP
ncbi:MAG TPA: hypothetical protein DEG09_00520 [Marinilabiliaceae bacterium]|nr:hypothetical protein [Marinilabiliaceae bacterium]HBX87081.1 hypothetical protein [Marinilabiliaceae bacterium]